MSRWKLMEELFDETVELNASERVRVLRERAKGDEELIQSVEALIAAHVKPMAVLDGSAAELLVAVRDEPSPELLCGATFGPYRVEEHLSTGGMGHVYRATRRTADTDRRVALKVLRPGLDTDAFLERFRQERRTLAALEHEHIVSFLDAGALPDGRPFLVMELVEGEPLTVWTRGVPLRRCLELFLQILAAVQYAHQKLVVHRDLKPSNVLVTRQGVPKLLDFGVASVLAEDGEVIRGSAPLTPAYASPEELRGDAATTASDVYSLGVLLHEIVTGVHPDIAEAVPTKLEPDLDAISRCARAAAPEERYPSVDKLADDLRRHLASEPVSVRRRSWAYAASCFARRHKWRVAVAAGALLILASGWVGSDLGRRRAEAEASLGWGAHGQAKVVARELESWIESITADNPTLSLAATAHLEGALEERLAELPEAETLVRLTLARLYVASGDQERAALHAKRAWELAQVTRGVGKREREQARVLLESLVAR